METAALEKGATLAEKRFEQTKKRFEKIGKQMGSVGKTMSAAFTLPIVGAGAAVLKMAGDFEAGMNRVSIATNASNEQMAKLRDLALDIGKQTTKSASESADAIDMLAKAGMSVEDILSGGARAAVALSEAAGSDLDPAAAAITDTMAQFKMTTAELPEIINNITGAVNESKLDFSDFQQAMGQAGGVAAGLGVEFEDFTAVLAGTSSMFSSGSDAGTSFKNFLTRFVPTTNTARDAMAKYNLQFFDASGSMKSMGAVAEMLRQQLGGLSEEAKNEVLKDLFGVDSMRTAIGLMDLGAAGLENIQAKIAATDASDQAAKRMQGLNAEMEKLGGALETLAIKIADSGLLSVVSDLIAVAGEWVDKLAELDPAVLRWGVAIAGIVAVVGPLLIGLGAVVSAMGALAPLAAALGPTFLIIKSALVILSPAVWAVVKALAAMALTPVGAVITAIALAVAAVYYVWKNWDKIEPIIRNLYNAAKKWIVDKLNAVWDTVKGKIDAVKGWFYGLYDAVVGHSYIPDMVDGIAQQMARLDSVMVANAKSATEKTKSVFEKLADDVQPLMERLFPEARQSATSRKERASLEAGIAAGGAGGYTAEQLTEAKRRQALEGLPNSTLDSLLAQYGGPLTEGMPDFAAALNTMMQKSEVATVTVVKSFADMGQDVLGSLQNLGNSIKSGGFLDVFSSVVGLLLQMGSLGVFGKSIQTNLAKTPSIPGYAKGTNFHPGGLAMVGERGPELVSMPRGSRVIPNDKLGGGNNMHFDLRGAVMTADLLAQMNSIGQASGMGGAMAGANLAESRMMSRGRRRIPG